MKRIAFGTILLMLVLAAPAVAAPQTPGVALVKATQTADPEDGDPEGNVSYNGAAGPLTGNVVTILQTGNQLTFTAPLTAIVPSPFAGDQLGNCHYGLGHGTCTIPTVGRYGYPGGCTGQVVGNRGADRITFRQEYPSDPYFPNDCWLILTTVQTKDGNDVVNAHDGQPTRIICGAGYDQVSGDSYDSAASDCESVGLY